MVVTIDSPLEAALAHRPKRSNLVCRCGHSEARHADLPRGTVCLGARETCRCEVEDFVLTAGDARVFMYSPEGSAHPLVAGMISLRTKGKTWEWRPGRGLCEVDDCTAEMKTAVYNDEKTRTQLRCEEHAA